jgi:hypothetical protein
VTPQWRRFRLWREGVVYALDGGLWLHPFWLAGERWAHLVSSDRAALLDVGRFLQIPDYWLQYRPLRDPRTGDRAPAWHWDLRGVRLTRALQLSGEV